MESINRIDKGVHADFNENAQPDGTARHSLNGRLNALGKGRYSWSIAKGNKVVFNSLAGQIIGICHIRKDIYYLAYNYYGPVVSLIKTKLNANQDGLDGGQAVIATYSNFNYDPDFPIRAMWGYYENDEIQRIYFTDFNNKPRTINVIDPQDDRFIDFTPVSDSIATFSFTDIVSGGSLYYGAYFIAYRLFNDDGFYSEYSYHSNPINVGKDDRGSGGDDYHDYNGGSVNISSGNKIQIDLDDIDTGYDSIEIIYFRSIDYNVILPGIVAFSGLITGSSMSFEIIGGETIGSVDIDDLILTNISIIKCKDMFPIKGYNTIYNLEEREELPIGSSIPGVSIEESKYEIVLDKLGTSGSATNNPITDVSILQAGTGAINLWGGWWYKAEATGSYTTISASTVVNFTIGDRFKCSDQAQLTSGEVTPIIRIRKYLKGTAVSPYSDSDYEWTEIDATGLYPNYRDPIISHHLKGYASNLTIRLGLLAWDLDGKPFFVRHIGDFTPSGRNDFGLITNYNDAGTTYGQNYLQLNGNIISLLISGIDITEYKDQISGFSIVRCVIPDVKIATGVLLPLINVATDEYKTLIPFHGVWDAGMTWYHNAYVIFSPEEQFNFKDIRVGDRIKNSIYMNPLQKTLTSDHGLAYGGPDCTGLTPNYKNHQKMYIKASGISSGNSLIDSENRLLQTTRVPFLNDSIVFDNTSPATIYRNRTTVMSTGRDALNAKMNIVITKNDENGGADPNVKPSIASNDSQCLIIDILRDYVNYGNSNDSGLAQMQYITVGHYQKVDTAFLADIEDGAGRFIINGVQIFGGDHYVSLYDCNLAVADNDDTDPSSWSFIVPLETKLNLDLREGRKFAQLQTYDPSIVTDGLLYDSSSSTIQIEEYLLNLSYSTDHIGDIYPGLPYNQSLKAIHDVMSRFSSHKVNGERQDSFRVFGTNDYRELDPRWGPITGAKPNGNYTVIWQPDSISYIPVTERQLQSAQFGQPIQMGVGEIFHIDDQVSDMLGNSHQFGMIVSPEGFLWWDAKRRLALKMDRSMKLTIDSILKGYNEVIEVNYNPELIDHDNPIHGYGISGGYEPGAKSGFLSFIYINPFTIGFDDISNAFTGLHSFYHGIYHQDAEVMLGLKTGYTAYAHDRGLYGEYGGHKFGAEISFIIKAQSTMTMIWDNIILNDLGLNFSSIEFSNYLGTVEEVLSNDSGVLTTQDYRRIRNEIRGSIPFVSDQRFDGHWLKVTLKISSTWSADQQVGMFQLLTKYRDGW